MFAKLNWFLELNTIVCAAGGWAGGDIAGEGVFEAVDKMWKFNVNSAVACAHVASSKLQEVRCLAN